MAADYGIGDSIFIPIEVTDRNGDLATPTEITVTARAPDGTHIVPLTLTGGTVYYDSLGKYHAAFVADQEATVGKPWGWRSRVELDDGNGGTWARSQWGTFTVAKDPSA